MKATRAIRIATLFCLSLTAATAQQVTAKIVRAANAFLGTLDAKQRQSVVFGFDDAKQRVRWSNLPVRMVPRAGLTMGEFERRAAHRRVRAALFHAEPPWL